MSNLNSVVTLLTMISLSAFSMACNGNSNGHNHHNNQENQMGRKAQTDLSPLMENYMNIKNALVNDNYGAVREASKNMMQLEDVPENITGSLNNMANADDLTQQRKHFSEVSRHMYKMAENGRFDGQTMYWSHCPMANDNEGANWLSLHQEVSNPYMGQKMLKCGSVKETIN